MKRNVRWVANILEILIGIALAACARFDLVDDFWGGMGTALILVGAILLVRQFRYSTSTSYREKVDVEINDERNKYISMKAWSWAGYSFVIIAAVATIALKIAGIDELVPIASGSVCLIVVLYWLAYVLLRRKY